MAYDPNDAADKAIFDAAVAEEVKGLTAKRDQLLGEVKELKATIKKGAGDPVAMERLEAQLETANASLEARTTELKDANKKLGKTTKDYETESAYSRNLLTQNALTDAFTTAKVAPQFLPAVKSLFAGKVTIKTEGDERKLYIGDKPLGEAVTAWSQSDEGKHYVSAGSNGGGGSPGGGAKQGEKSVSRSAFEAMPHTERPAFFAGGGTVTD